MTNPTPILASIQITPAAASQLQALGQQGKRVRLAINAGGCSGFQRQFSFGEPAADDVFFGPSGAELLMDPTSAELIAGATVDYVNNLAAAEFTLTIPTASNSCGCGASFNLPE